VFGWYVSQLKGIIADDLGAYRAALNHLRFAERRHNDQGVAVTYAKGFKVGGRRPPATMPAAAALVLVCDKADILNNIGYVHLFRLGEPDKALPYFRKALKENDAHDGAWRNLIVCLSTLEKDGEARREVRAASRKLGPDPRLEEIANGLEMGAFAFAPFPQSARRSDQVTHRCKGCDATYYLTESDVLCGRCGGDYELPAGTASQCPFCSNTSVVMLGKYASYANGVEPTCPICWDGVLCEAN
jgi:tetratricopeptide (TPR) repeat protein